MPMVRTQVQLTQEQAETLKQLSAKTGLSIAELLRRGLRPLLRDGLVNDDQDQRARRAAEVSGRFHSGKTDIAAEHDRYLTDR